jgi:HAD superfamily hydrolase (TIGR01490 family)
MSAHRLALFDFDGTVTSRDTLFEFIRFTHGKAGFTSGLMILSPVLVLFKLKILGNQRTKDIVLSHFYSGTPVVTFNQRATEFLDRVREVIRPAALEIIREYQQQKARVIVVSASPENWVKPWCDLVGIECIATRLEAVDSKITGKIAGLNCHGEEKVRRIRELVNLSDYDEVYVYGDTPSDRPMMSLATRSFYKPFR